MLNGRPTGLPPVRLQVQSQVSPQQSSMPGYGLLEVTTEDLPGGGDNAIVARPTAE